MKIIYNKINFKFLAFAMVIFISTLLILFYIFTPFGKSRVFYGEGVYKGAFGVYYVNKFLFHNDMGYFGTQNIFPLIKKIPEADKLTFKSLNGLNVAKDKNLFYVFDRNFTSSGHEYRKYEVFEDFNMDKIVNSGNYYYDDNHIVFAYHGLHIIKDADLDSIRFLDSETAIDSNNYYCAYKAFSLPENFTLKNCTKKFGSDGNKIYSLFSPSYDSWGVLNNCLLEYPIKIDPKHFVTCGNWGKDGNILYSTAGEEYTPEKSGKYYNEFLKNFNDCLEKCQD